MRRELDEGEAAGYGQIAPEWLTVKSLSHPLSQVSLAALDEGEAA